MAERNPDAMRRRLLDAAFWQFYRNGYQGASLTEILKVAGAAKGGLYHHFASKRELAYAVLEEVISEWLVERWLDLLKGGTDPISALGRGMRRLVETATPEMLELGCPLNNLAQEMSPLDEGFRERIEKLFGRWQDGIADALAGGIREGTVRADVDPQRAAAFILGSFEGAVGLAKSKRDLKLVKSNVEMLIDYLETMRTEPAAVTA